MSDTPMFFRQMAVRKMAVDMAIPEKTIEMVLKHSFEGARKAFYKCASIEISGFGTFVLSANRVKGERRRISMELEKWNRQIADPESTPMMVKNRLLFINEVEQQLAIMKTLTHEI